MLAYEETEETSLIIPMSTWVVLSNNAGNTNTVYFDFRLQISGTYYRYINAYLVYW